VSKSIVTFLFRLLKTPPFEKLQVNMRTAYIGGVIIVFINLIIFVKDLPVVKDNLFAPKIKTSNKKGEASSVGYVSFPKNSTF